jgi:hypothetical protein
LNIINFINGKYPSIEFERRKIIIEADILLPSIHWKNEGVGMPIEGNGSRPITTQTITAIFVNPIILKRNMQNPKYKDKNFT